MQPWQIALAEYLQAVAFHREAEHVYIQTARTFEKLARRIGDERAWQVAGMSLADERAIRAYTRKRRAGEGLKKALAGASTLQKLTVAGRISFARLPEAANR